MSELNYLSSIKQAFNCIEQFEPSNCPIEYETLPAMGENATSEVLAIYHGNFVSLIRRIERSDNQTIYTVDSVVNGKTQKVVFANYTSILKAQKVAAVIAAFGPSSRLVWES